MTRVLASVTSVSEAAIVLESGAGIIDLKNPLQGALGALSLNTIREVVDFINGSRPVSATVGDLPMQPNLLCNAVAETAETGVDIIKVGLFGSDGHEECIKALTRITRGGTKIVAVMFADQQPDLSILPLLAEAGFYGAMLDTADKSAGGLRHWMSADGLQQYVASSKDYGLLTGLAGSLRMDDIAHLIGLGSDYLGFRGALCLKTQRQSELDPKRVSAICAAVAQMQHTEHNEASEDCIAGARCV